LVAVRQGVVTGQDERAANQLDIGNRAHFFTLGCKAA
jgi:hypothetical protein